MNNREYSILILANFASVYVVQFVKNLKKANPAVHIYVLETEPTKGSQKTQHRAMHMALCCVFKLPFPGTVAENQRTAFFFLSTIYSPGLIRAVPIGRPCRV